MISDGIENCLQYIDNFNPEKSSNPFAYFTQIVYYAFLRRIQKEKKYLYTKYKVTEHENVLGETSDRQEGDIGKDFNDGIKSSEWSQEYMSDFIQNFEETKRKKRKQRTHIEDK
jgi:DNA-directed RNA polymerase specialized sigma24 family protein